MNSRLQTALRAARAAGKILAAKRSDEREIHSKGKRDIVTDADFAADRAIRETLLARFPHDHILSEESDARERKALWARAQAEPDLVLWIVDPLDGTTNYAHRLPLFSTSIALYRAGAVQAGVVYDPISKELFWAERGHGAFLNGKRIHPSPIRNLAEAVIGTEWARDQIVRERASAIFEQAVNRVTTARVLGSAALSLCYVAAGRLDAYYHLSLSPWDVAAAGLIVEEAGGAITTPTGEVWNVNSKSFVASNRHLHRCVLQLLR